MQDTTSSSPTRARLARVRRKTPSTLLTLLALAVTLAATRASAQEGNGTVQLPLSVYQELLGAGGSESRASHALGVATVEVDVQSGAATVTATMQASITGEGWASVPLLPAGVSVVSATAGGAPVQLVPTPQGLAWLTNSSGNHPLRVVYQVPVSSAEGANTLRLPLPSAPSSNVRATLPGTERGVSLVPASTTTTSVVGGRTRLSAQVVGASGAQLSWRRAGEGEGYTLSRASYRGTLEDGALQWRVELGVELATSDRVVVPLLPSSVALASLTVDRTDAPISVSDAGGRSRFAVALSGRGRHTVVAEFQVPLLDDGGLPGVSLSIPRVPVSRFEVELPGQKEVQVQPSVGVHHDTSQARTLARFHLPMNEALTLRWSEAVPEATEEVEARANAEWIHVAHAEEGVVQLRAQARYEITRGAVRQVDIEVPEEVLVNEVTSPSGVVNDWRLEDGVLTVYLDREVTDAFRLDVSYERGVEMNEGASESFRMPLLRARGAHRQRGMVALLASRELGIEPRTEEGVTAVGDNQLPTDIRDAIDMTVAHTYRYLDELPALEVATARRELEQGRFDVQVDTLVSLDDVTTRVSATIDAFLKSGSLSELRFTLPEGVQVLDVSAPSLREHREVNGVHVVEMTQPMEGRLRVEVSYERITAAQEGELGVPLLHVVGADVERGRMAVEALAPFQVDVADAAQLSVIEVGELPQQLVLRTQNPILHAYRYAHADPPPQLALRITRHQELQTQHATIDDATYRTVYTRDGFAVTIARFVVRNQREQFLRVALPEGSEVWSARVDGRPETPALAADAEEDAPEVLVNIVSSDAAFPVELVYATHVGSLGAFGRATAELATPQMVVTRTRWEVYLPEDARYAAASSDLRVVEDGQPVYGGLLEDVDTESLRIHVPDSATRFVFEKMYAGQAGETSRFSVAYASGWGSPVLLVLSVLGALLLCVGLFGFGAWRYRWLEPVPTAAELEGYRDAEETEVPAPPIRFGRRSLIVLGVATAAGLLLLAFTLGYLSTPLTMPLGVAMIACLGAAGVVLRRKKPRWFEVPKKAPHSQVTEAPDPTQASLDPQRFPQAPQFRGDSSESQTPSPSQSE